MGCLILTSSHLETSINIVIKAIYRHWDGEKISSKVPNIQIKRKIKFLRDWYKTKPEFEKTHGWLPEILNYVSATSRIRGAIAHGMMQYDFNLELQDITEASFVFFNADAAKSPSITAIMHIEQLHSITRVNLCLVELFDELSLFLMKEANLDDHFSSLTKKLTRLLSVLDDVGNLFEQFRTNNLGG